MDHAAWGSPPATQRPDRWEKTGSLGGGVCEGTPGPAILYPQPCSNWVVQDRDPQAHLLPLTGVQPRGEKPAVRSHREGT